MGGNWGAVAQQGKENLCGTQGFNWETSYYFIGMASEKLWNLSKDNTIKNFKLCKWTFRSLYQVNNLNEQKYRKKGVMDIILGLMVSYRSK